LDGTDGPLNRSEADARSALRGAVGLAIQILAYKMMESVVVDFDAKVKYDTSPRPRQKDQWEIRRDERECSADKRGESPAT
jgi:hypothetical protein